MGEQEGRSHPIHELLIDYPPSQVAKALGLDENLLAHQGERETERESEAKHWISSLEIIAQSQLNPACSAVHLRHPATRREEITKIGASLRYAHGYGGIV